MSHVSPLPAPRRAATAIDPAVESVLRGDPSGVYARCDPRTQWQLRGAVAEWARRSAAEPLAVARLALERAERARDTEGATSSAAHVGYYLVGDGTAALGAELERASGRAPGRPEGLPPRLLFPVQGSMMAILVAACAAAVLGGAAPDWARALAVAAAVPLASVYASRLVRALRWCRRPNPWLPRLRSGEALAEGEAVLVVIPALVPSPEHAAALVSRLWALHEANPAPELRFALLSDFADAPSESTPGDDAVLHALREALAGLNARVDGDRFFVLHRPRRWSRTERAWIGWERKRGKLHELARLVDGQAEASGFAWRFGDVEGLLRSRSIPFVITLDEASWPAPGAIAELVGTAAHPLNRPVVDGASGRVTSGYAVLQPAVIQGGSPPPPGRPAGQPSFWFRALGVGIHRGAGALFHPAALRRATDGAFADETVLHHDLLDGFVGRTGEVMEAAVLQPPPGSYPAQARRGHRWLRGLLQAAPLLVARRSGARRDPLTPAQRCILAELVLSELSTPASLVLLLLGWSVLPGPALVWTLAASPALVGPALALARTAGRRRPGWRPALHDLAAGLFAHVVLVYQGFLVMDALVRVAWRMGVSRRHLLEWAPRHDPGAGGDVRSWGYVRALWPSPMLGALVLGAWASGRIAFSPMAVPFAAAWIVAPWLVGWGDRRLRGNDGEDRGNAPSAAVPAGQVDAAETGG